MAGGTVTIVGGNVIHTFTSSGYLSPIVLLNRSLRFRSSASAYLSRTPSVAGNRQKFTISMWVKRGDLTARQGIIAAGTSNSSGQPGGSIYFDNSTSGGSHLSLIGAGGTSYVLQTTQVFRDPAAWYHLVFAWDTTQATDSNRIKMYINGVQVTSWISATYPSQNFSTDYNNTTVQGIGTRTDDGAIPASPFDGYMTEVYMIDGQALTPSSFGSFNAYGSWSPVRYGGSYGTNGFYLPFTNSISTTTLGYDFSPQGNNWTTNNISLGATVAQTFASSTTWTVPVGVYKVDYLVVGGGGGGANVEGGGAGGGGFVEGSLTVSPGTTYPITVGAGGAINSNGGNSVFSIVTAYGGGQQRTDGGSGGGGGNTDGSSNQGNSIQTSPAGGTGYGNRGGNKVSGGGYANGGGGDAGGAGGDASGFAQGGSGGPGRASSISGTSVTYAGGGGGWGYYGSGGGAGGAYGAGGSSPGGVGGGGVVIISYANPASSLNDSVTDVPTLTSATAANYCTLNPLDRGTSYYPSLSNGNLYYVAANNTQNPARGTLAVTTGKYYFEATIVTRGYNPMVGVMTVSSSLGTGDNFKSLWGTQAAGWSSYTGGSNGIVSNGSNSSYGTAMASGDVIMVAFDVDNGKLWVGKNGTWNNSANPAAGTGNQATFARTDPITPFFDGTQTGGSADTWAPNFGQRPFTYTPPSGFVALNTYNL